MRPGVTLSLVLVAVTFMTGPAQASYPGGPGKVALQSDRDGNLEIYTTDPLTRLTNNSAIDEHPTWSADGAKIYFDSTRDGNYEIYSMNADGSGQTRITNNPAFEEMPTLSPDGTKIVFDSGRDDPQGEIYTMNADGTNVVRLTNDPGFDFGGTWSPDGTKIAWQSTRTGGQVDVYTMNADGTSQLNRTNNAARDEWPNWSPDGTKIAFITNRAGNTTRLYQMNADGSSPTGMITNRNDPIRSADWRPDGKTFVFSERYAATGSRLYTTGAESPDQGPVQILVSNGGDPKKHDFPSWQALNNSYARPQGATPIRLALVPASKQCTTPQTTHRGAIGAPACYGPAPESPYLTVGTPDFNGVPAQSGGSVLFRVDLAPANGTIAVNLTDVRCQGTSAGCAGGALSDYTGSLLFASRFRITDKNNGPTGLNPSRNGTVTDLDLTFPVLCQTTASTTIGSTCATTTTIDAVFGGTTAVEDGKRAIWESIAFPDGRWIQITDGGPDGVGQTFGNSLYMVSGLFFP